MDQLIKKCLEGDQRAQRELIDTYGPKLFVVCKRYATLRIDATDIFQEAMIKIFEMLDRYDADKGKFEGWIYRVTVNTALKLLRDLGKHENHDNMEDFHVQEAASAEMPDNLGHEELLSFIQKLPPMQQLIFNLHAIEGYKHEEIATQLEISAGTSRSQYLRAKQKLQKMHNELNSVK